MLRTIFVLAGATAYAAVAESDAYPMIEYWQADDYRANPLCDMTDNRNGLSNDGISLMGSAPDFPYRKSAGLKNLSNRLKEMYAKLSRQGVKRIDFESTNRRTSSDYDSVLQAALVKTIARRRAKSGSGDSPIGVGAEVCNMLATKAVDSSAPSWPTSVASSRFDTESFCNVMKGVAQELYCQDNYIYEGSAAAIYANSLDGNSDRMTDPNIDPSCYTATSSSQDPLDLKIQQYRNTPDVIEWNLIDGVEKKVFYLLRKSISNLEKYAEKKLLEAQLNNGSIQTKRSPRKTNSIHTLFTDEEIFNYILPEWKVKRIIHTNEVSDNTSLRLPFAVISQRGNSNMLLTLRQSLTNFDARFTLYNQLSFKYLYNFTGQLHDGASTYFQSVISPIVHEISKALEKTAKTTQDSWTSEGPNSKLSDISPIFKLTVTAADVPGIGTAAAIGNHVSRLFGKRIQVDVVGFGSPYFADKDMMDNLRNNVELRVVQVEGDSTDLISCPQSISCDHTDLIIRTGVESGVLYAYQMAHGYVNIPLDYLATTDRVWGSESTLYQLAAIRECGYNCALALAACGYATNSNDISMCFASECLAFV